MRDTGQRHQRDAQPAELDPAQALGTGGDLPRDFRAAALEPEPEQALLDQGAMPRRNWQPSSIENFMEQARPGDKLFIRANGEFALKDSRDRENPVMAVLEKDQLGQLWLRDGPPSLNGTYFEDDRGRLTQIRESREAAPGSKLALSRDFTFVVPAAGEALPDTAPNYLQALASAPSNVPELLGRHDRSIANNHVSRAHCTVTRLENGNLLVTDGVPSREGSEVKLPGRESFERVSGWIKVPPGSAVAVGGFKRFVVPEPPEVHASFANFMGENMAHSMTINVAYRRAVSGSLRPEIDPDRLRVTPEQAMVLGEFLEKGLELMRGAAEAGQARQGARPSMEEHKQAIHGYQQVLQYFSNDGAMRVAGATGFSFEQNNWLPLANLEPATIGNNLDLVASRSWFTSGLKIYPSVGGLPRDFDAEHSAWIDPETGRNVRDATLDEMKFAAEYLREICLIMAEEWTHGYQHALGKCVSKRGALLEEMLGSAEAAHEYDVAHVLKEHLIPMSARYTARYGRDDMLELMRGVQLAADRDRIPEMIAARKPGEAFTIGREGDVAITPPRTDPDGFFDTVAAKHCALIPTSDGFILTNHAQRGTFYSDQQGFWHKLADDAVTISADARLRLGPYYELRLKKD